jgi:hypothetical protein
MSLKNASAQSSDFGDLIRAVRHVICSEVKVRIERDFPIALCFGITVATVTQTKVLDIALTSTTAEPSAVRYECFLCQIIILVHCSKITPSLHCQTIQN